MQLNFIVTNRCNVSCRFCAPACGPKASEEHLSAEQMIGIIDDVMRDFHLGLVVFTGGEPLLHRTQLLQTIRYAGGLGIHSRIVTNGFWAFSAASALKTLTQLKEAGLGEMNLSVDDFHQEFIPVENIRYAVQAAKRLGIPMHLAHKSYPGSQSNRETYETLIGEPIALLSEIDPGQVGTHPVTFASGWTVPVGRGAEIVDAQTWLPPWYDEADWRRPCLSVMETVSIGPSGDLSPCCGLVDRNLEVFYAGNVLQNRAGEVISAASDLALYNWLALEGPAAIMEFVREKDPSLQFSDAYVQSCQVCQELFSNEKALQILSENIESVALKLAVERSMFEAKRELYFRYRAEAVSECAATRAP